MPCLDFLGWNLKKPLLYLKSTPLNISETKICGKIKILITILGLEVENYIAIFEISALKLV